MLTIALFALFFQCRKATISFREDDSEEIHGECECGERFFFWGEPGNRRWWRRGCEDGVGVGLLWPLHAVVCDSGKKASASVSVFHLYIYLLFLLVLFYDGLLWGLWDMLYPALLLLYYPLIPIPISCITRLFSFVLYCACLLASRAMVNRTREWRDIQDRIGYGVSVMIRFWFYYCLIVSGEAWDLSFILDYSTSFSLTFRTLFGIFCLATDDHFMGDMGCGIYSLNMFALRHLLVLNKPILYSGRLSSFPGQSSVKGLLSDR